MTRTLLHRASACVGVKFNSKHPLVPWALRHAGFLLTHLRMLEHGRTPYQILRQGKHYRGEVLEFEEQCFGMDPSDTAKVSKLQVKWRRHIWSVKVLTSGEYILCDKSKLVKVRTVPDERGPQKRCDLSAMQAMTAFRHW